MNAQFFLKKTVVHPFWLRLTHWLNALSVVIMISSGWRIYNASPLFGFSFPNNITIGGWLGGALEWHFAAMWLFFFNGLLYITLSILTGRFQQRFLPINLKGFFDDFFFALKGKLNHDNFNQYNMVQKVAYLSVILDGFFIIISGLVLWKSVQFPFLRDVMGSYDTARLIHFIAMSYMCLFIIIHLTMVALVPKTLILMIRGR